MQESFFQFSGGQFPAYLRKIRSDGVAAALHHVARGALRLAKEELLAFCGVPR
jgi:hypothetical protein